MKNLVFVYNIIILILISGCSSSTKEHNTVPNSHYTENFKFYFELCENALFNNDFQPEKLLQRGFKKNNLDVTGAPNYLLPGFFGKPLVSFTFPYARTPSQCRVKFNFISKQPNMLEPAKTAIESLGYILSDRVFLKDDRKVSIRGKLRTNNNGTSLFFEIDRL